MNIINKSDYEILIVDDDLEVINANINILKDEGYTNVIGCDNGKEAIEIVKNKKFDVMILDFFMPGLTGEDVVEAVRTFNNEIVIIINTGYAGEIPPIFIFERLNIQGYVDKNSGPENLLTWLFAAIRIQSQNRENKRLFEKIALMNKSIEEIKKNQEMLIEQSRLALLGQLTGSISHNIKTPLMCDIF